LDGRRVGFFPTTASGPRSGNQHDYNDYIEIMPQVANPIARFEQRWL